jgi:N-acetylglutamate synthase-like GNAT family acetyltransferase
MIKFQIATSQDIPALVKLVNSAYRGESSEKGWTTEATILDGQRIDSQMLKEILDKENNQILMLLLDDKFTGCVHLIFEADSLYFGMLTIDPTIQSKGLGKELLKEIEKIAINSARSKIRISVIHTRSELIAFYERRGFCSTGKWDTFPENDPRYGIPKIKDLKLLEFEKKLHVV